MKRIIAFILFIISLSLVIYGQKTVGYNYLFMQLVGLAGLLGLLYAYNKQFK